MKGTGGSKVAILPSSTTGFIPISERAERFFVHGRLLLADDMRLGKTAQPIGRLPRALHTGRIRRGPLVILAALSRSGFASGGGSPTLPLPSSSVRRTVGAGQ